MTFNIDNESTTISLPIPIQAENQGELIIVVCIFIKFKHKLNAKVNHNLSVVSVYFRFGVDSKFHTSLVVAVMKTDRVVQLSKWQVTNSLLF